MLLIKTTLEKIQQLCWLATHPKSLLYTRSISSTLNLDFKSLKSNVREQGNLWENIQVISWLSMFRVMLFYLSILVQTTKSSYYFKINHLACKQVFGN